MNQFSETDKTIYGPYFNGVQQVYGDPIRLHRRLIHGLSGEQAQVLSDIRNKEAPEQVRFEATERFLAASVFAFELAAFDPATGQGMQENAVLALAKDFLGWIKKKEPSTPTAPTCAPPIQDTSPVLAG